MRLAILLLAVAGCFGQSQIGQSQIDFRTQVKNKTADQLTYTAPGAGAVARTQAAKNADTLSVKDYGAIGDGVHDDTPNIQAATDYAATSGASVYFPVGTYRVTNTLYMKDKVMWHGEGRSGPGSDIVADTVSFAALAAGTPMIQMGTSGGSAVFGERIENMMINGAGPLYAGHVDILVLNYSAQNQSGLSHVTMLGCAQYGYYSPDAGAAESGLNDVEVNCQNSAVTSASRAIKIVDAVAMQEIRDIAPVVGDAAGSPVAGSACVELTKRTTVFIANIHPEECPVGILIGSSIADGDVGSTVVNITNAYGHATVTTLVEINERGSDTVLTNISKGGSTNSVLDLVNGGDASTLDLALYAVGANVSTDAESAKFRLSSDPALTNKIPYAMLFNSVTLPTQGQIRWGTGGNEAIVADTSSHIISLYAGDVGILALSPTLNQSLVNFKLATGLTQGVGFQHYSANTGTIPAAETHEIAFAWTLNFTDTSYTATCTAIEGTESTNTLEVVKITAKTAGGMSVSVRNLDVGGSHSGSINCIGIHP